MIIIVVLGRDAAQVIFGRVGVIRLLRTEIEMAIRQAAYRFSPADAFRERRSALR